MSPSDTRSGTVTRTDRPISSSNATQRTGTGVPHITTTVLRTGSPAQRSAEPRTPQGSVPRSETPSRASPSTPLNKFTTLADWDNPAFVQEKVTDMERELSTTKGVLQQVQNYQQRNNVIVDVANLAAEINDNVDAKFEEFRKQMVADNKVAFKRLKTETLGPMSVTLTSMNQAVQTLEKQFRIFQVGAGHAAPSSQDVIANLDRVEEHTGQPVPSDIRDTLNAIAEEPPAGHVADSSPASDVDMAQLQGVPSTPTPPDTPSAEANLTIEQTQYFLTAMHNMTMLFQSVGVKSVGM